MLDILFYSKAYLPKLAAFKLHKSTNIKLASVGVFIENVSVLILLFMKNFGFEWHSSQTRCPDEAYTYFSCVRKYVSKMCVSFDNLRIAASKILESRAEFERVSN